MADDVPAAPFQPGHERSERLVNHDSSAYGRAMTTRTPAAGGFFIFLGLIAGIVLGVRAGQLATGMFAGFAIGLAVAAIIWAIDRRRA